MRAQSDELRAFRALLRKDNEMPGIFRATQSDLSFAQLNIRQRKNIKWTPKVLCREQSY